MAILLESEDTDHADGASKTHAHEGSRHGGAGVGNAAALTLRVGARVAGAASGRRAAASPGGGAGAGAAGAEARGGVAESAVGAGDGAVARDEGAGADDGGRGSDGGGVGEVAGAAGDGGDGGAQGWVALGAADERGGGGGQRRDAGEVGGDEVALDVGGQGGEPRGSLASGELGGDLTADGGGVGDGLSDEGAGEGSLEHAEDGVEVLGSNGGRKSGEGDKLVLHLDCVVDAVKVKVEDRLRKVMRRSTTTVNESLEAKKVKKW